MLAAMADGQPAAALALERRHGARMPATEQTRQLLSAWAASGVGPCDGAATAR
jgi:hypothetical protein